MLAARPTRIHLRELETPNIPGAAGAYDQIPCSLNALGMGCENAMGLPHAQRLSSRASFMRCKHGSPCGTAKEKKDQIV
jgi:hypothetical protein